VKIQNGRLAQLFLRSALAEKRPVILCEMHGEENRRILLDEFSRSGCVCKNCGDRHTLALQQ
jgi:hypothetical protein